MTFEELHKILDDDNKKITLQEFREIIYELKNDCFREQLEPLSTHKQGFYNGEINAFYLALSKNGRRIKSLVRYYEKEIISNFYLFIFNFYTFNFNRL